MHIDTASNEPRVRCGAEVKPWERSPMISDVECIACLTRCLRARRSEYIVGDDLARRRCDVVSARIQFLRRNPPMRAVFLN